MNVSAIQLVKVRTAMQEVPDDSKSEAFVLLAECLCELAGREKPLAWQVPDPRPFDLFRQDAERICAEHMPPAGHAGPTPPAHPRHHRPDRHTVPATHPARGSASLSAAASGDNASSAECRCRQRGSTGASRKVYHSSWGHQAVATGR